MNKIPIQKLVNNLNKNSLKRCCKNRNCFSETLKSLTYVQLIFVYGVKQGSNFSLSTKIVMPSHISSLLFFYLGFPWCSDGKESACNVGDLDSMPGWERSRGGGQGNPLQSSCMENPMDRRAWQVTVRGGHKDADTTKHILFFLIFKFFNLFLLVGG